MKKIQQELNFEDPNVGLSIIVGTNKFVMMMASSVVRVMGRRENYLFMDNMDEALATLAARLKQGVS